MVPLLLLLLLLLLPPHPPQCAAVPVLSRESSAEAGGVREVETLTGLDLNKIPK